MMINNVKSFIVKHDNLFVGLLSIILVSGIAFRVLIVHGDEIWNFNNVYKMYNGLTIYQDSNVIVTPLFYIIGNLIFNIVGANFLVFRIYNVAIFLTLFLSMYILFKNLGITKGRAAIYISAMIMIHQSMIPSGANYNSLAMIFVIVSIIIEILRIKALNIKPEKIYKYDIYQGILFFLIFMSKQNIIVFYLIGIVISRFILNKDKMKEIKSIFISGITSVFLLIPVVMALINQGVFMDFINYAVLGIKEFGTSNIGHEIISLLEGISINLTVIIIVIVAILKSKLMNLDKDSNHIIKMLFCVAIALLGVAFPIFNKYHILLSSIVMKILLIFVLDIILIRNIFDEKTGKMVKYIIMTMLLAYMAYCGIQYVSILKEVKIKDIGYEYPYFGGIIETETQEEIDVITTYIKENDKRVVILSYQAALYMVPLKQSNGAMDLPFLGNMGKDGEDGMIEQISLLTNTQILISQEEKFWQESEKIVQYVKDNLRLIGEINKFDIYETIDD